MPEKWEGGTVPQEPNNNTRLENRKRDAACGAHLSVRVSQATQTEISEISYRRTV